MTSLPHIKTGADVAALFDQQIAVGAWHDEDALQGWLASRIALNTASLCSREIRLSDGISRIDLLIYTTSDDASMDGVGVEVKIKGSYKNTLRQLERYALCPELVELVLVTTKASHMGMPAQLNSKPLTVVALLEGGL